MTSFTPSKGRVYLAGSALPDRQVDDLISFFQAREAAAEEAAAEARSAWIDLEDARCKAMDTRFDARGIALVRGGVGASRSQPLSDAGPVARAATNLNAI